MPGKLELYITMLTSS